MARRFSAAASRALAVRRAKAWLVSDGRVQTIRHSLILNLPVGFTGSAFKRTADISQAGISPRPEGPVNQNSRAYKRTERSTVLLHRHSTPALTSTQSQFSRTGRS